jgi:MFS family permease
MTGISAIAGGLPRQFWYLWAGTLVNRAGAFVVVLLAIYLTGERGFSVSYAGLVLGLYGAGGALGTMVGGVLADRWGRRPTLLTAHLGAVVLMLTLGAVSHRVAVAAAALVLGVFAEGSRPAFAAMMVDIVPPADRLRAYNLNYWAINLGFALAAMLAGLAAEVDYLLLFVIDAATTLVTALIVFVKVRESRPVRGGPAGGAGGTATPRVGLRTVLADRVFGGFVLLNLLLALVFMQHLSTLPIAMRADGLSPSTFGWVIALNGVLIVTGQLFVPRLIRGRGHSGTLAVAAAVVGVGFGLTAVADTATMYAVTVLVWTLGEMLNSPSTSVLLAELAPAAARGRYQGVYSLSWQAAAFGAPVLGGYVQQHAGGTVLWLGSAAVCGVAALGHALSGPARERRARAAETPAEAPAEPENRVASKVESGSGGSGRTLTPVSAARSTAGWEWRRPPTAKVPPFPRRSR